MAGEPVVVNKPSVKLFNCPACGVGIVLRALGQSVSAVCGSCGTVVDTTNENYEIIMRASRAKGKDPLIPLGQRGKLKGTLWEVIGFMTRVDGTGTYYWDEYLLFNPTKGFRWLTQANGHWNYVIMTKEKPMVEEGTDFNDYGRRVAKYLNKKYFLFQKGTAKAVYVVGEFYWRVTVNESVNVEDYISPPEILSCEKNAGETIWSVGEYIDASTIKKAFEIREAMPAQLGVAPNQTSTIAGGFAATASAWAFMVGVVTIIQFATMFLGHNERVFETQFIFSSYESDSSRTTPIFNLKHGVKNVEIVTAAPLNNNWVEVEMDLVNDDNGTTYELTQGLEYYSGFDEDGGWSEGSRRMETVLSSIPEGRYHLNLEVSGPGLPKPMPENVTAGYTEVKTPDNAVRTEEHWPNGKIKSSTPRVDGKIEGVVRMYGADGHLEVESSFKNDKRHGTTRTYDEVGNMVRVDSYVDGIFQKNFFAHDNANGDVLPLGLTVKRDVVTWSNYLLILTLLSLYPLVIWWMHRDFEMSRWSESDFSPYASQRDE